MRSCRVLLFGDLSVAFEDDLRALLHIRDNPLLSSFLEQVGARIRADIGCLGAQQQSLFPRFTTLIDLVSKLGETEGTPALKFCLLSICQIGQFLEYFGQEGRQYPTPQDTYCLGICTGSFAAAAINCSRSLTELISVAIEAVVVAFRTSLFSLILKNDIVGNQEQTSGSWSVVVAGEESDFQQKIQDFADSEQLHQIWRPYISAVTPNHLTLSGPPGTLARFITSTQQKAHSLCINSPYHAPHIFDESLIQKIVDTQAWEALGDKIPSLTQLSPSIGRLETAKDFEALLKAAVEDSLRGQVRWDHILHTIVESFLSQNIQRCTVVPICSNASQLLSGALNRANIEAPVEKVFSPPKISPTQHGHFADSKIAIIGYSGRFPDSASNEEFWELLKAGKDVHREVPEDRFNWKTHYDPTGKTKNTSRVKYGCWIKEPGVFDARFFNISPREAENTDPAQRLAITTVYEAMEMAGMVPNRTPSTQQDRIGVFFGTTSDDWREVNSGQDVDTYFIPGGNRAFVPGRISYFFRFSGPSLSMDTACSSSFAAIQTACAYLWRGECDTAVAGGTNILTNPDNFVGLDRGHFLSTTGNCNAFDDGASGYCRADAVGSVILKRLEDAEMDNDPIFGIISGATTNHCGQTDSITRPHEGDQTSVFKRIIRHAGVNALDVSYVEMHGTGTQAGDATEMNSVLSVFVPERERMPRHPLYIGSAKANIGHAESASGVSSLIKVLMMMKHSEIPPHCGIKTKINHNYPLDLKERNVNIAFKPTSWLREETPCGKRFAFLNNFSAAGGNTAVLLEDAPLPTAQKNSDPRTFHIVALSSKTAKSLKGNMEALVNHLETHTEMRMQHPYRVVAVGNDTISIAQVLRSKLATIEPKTIPPAARVPKVAFMFTGQGSFYCGLGKELFSLVSSFREDMDRFEKIALQHGFPSFLNVIQNSDMEEMNDPVVTQLAMACTQMALCRLWISWGVKPGLTIGHSLGEYAALFAADALSASDTIFLVGTRAKLLNKHCTPGTHSMLAVKAPVEKVKPLIERSTAEIACLNQPTATVISGRIEEINRLEEESKAAGHETTRLNVPFAFHSSQVDAILEEFEATTRQVNFHPLSVPYVSPLLSEVLPEGGTLDHSYLVKACRQAVNFEGALKEASATGLVNEKTIWLEIGSHPACSGMVKGTLGSKSNTAATLRKDTDTWKILTTTLEMLYLSGIGINWNEYHRDFEQFNNVVDLPRYSWDLKNYWIMYRNDFCLTKGEGTQPIQEMLTEPPKAFKYISPSLQRVIEESDGDCQSTILVESDAHNSRLSPIFTGHRVNGAELCPSSLWGDIALNLGNYFMDQRSMSSEGMGLDVCRMQIQKPLVLNPNLTSQLFRVSAVANWTENLVKIAIFSVNAKGSKIIDHATCTVELVPAQTWTKEWDRTAYLVRSRIKALRYAVKDGDAHHMKQDIVYRLFANIVEYSPEYQGMREVIMDSQELEAVSTVKFQVDEQGFYFNPQWMDSVGGVAGFIMNGNDSPHPKAEVFINHGWSNMKCTTKLEKGKTYHCYNRMQLLEGALYTGDTYIFEGAEIIGIIEQIKFLGVPRQALDGLRPVLKGVQTPPTTRATESRISTPPVLKGTTDPVRKVPNPAPVVSGSIWLGILAIISEEVGVDLKDLNPETEFAELGLDSLLSLTITGRMREELNMDLPSSIFVDCATVKELQQLHGSDGGDSSTANTSSSSTGRESGISTPDTSLASERQSLDYVLILHSIISEETGIKVEDLSPSTRLDEIGVDSLLALTTIGRLIEIFEIELPSSLFSENETLLEVEKGIAAILGAEIKTLASVPAPVTQQPAVAQDAVVQNAPQATSVLLQGSPKSATSIVFMFPDGSGSASSYATLSKIDPTVMVYGLNCPWRTTPEDMARSKCTLSQYTAKFVIELQRRQPKGPYSLGGWSAGGICAFEAARQLVAAGEVVASLILIDSPNPIGLQNPPARMYDFFQQLGIFGTGGAIPAWLRPHFDAFIRMLDAYEPVPWPKALGQAPKTLIVYATDGVCKDPNGPRPEIRPDDPREMIWLINTRTDFSADGWASLLGRSRLTVEVLKDVHHFSMMDPGPQMDKMGAHMRNFLV
ncbi:polyketide synthase [Ilyonectria destructans]|nr:polyketide synthase [Ilyonectria destructans]